MRILSKNLRIAEVKPCRCRYCQPALLAPFILFAALTGSWFVAKIYKENKS